MQKTPTIAHCPRSEWARRQRWLKKNNKETIHPEKEYFYLFIKKCNAAYVQRYSKQNIGKFPNAKQNPTKVIAEIALLPKLLLR